MRKQKKIRYVLSYNSITNNCITAMPVEVDDIYQTRVLLDSFLLDYSKGWRVGSINMFGRNFSNIELNNYELMTIDEWFDCYTL